MAIKINNTTVVNDSRELENITNLKTVGGQSILGTGDIPAGDVTLSGSQVLTNKTISNGTYSDGVEVNGSIRTGVYDIGQSDTINCTSGNYFTKIVNGNISFAISSAPYGKAYSFILKIEYISGTITWPMSVRWPGNSAPTLTSGKTHLFVFISDNGGQSWYASSNINLGA